MRKETKYYADDGTAFDTFAECKEYEDSVSAKKEYRGIPESAINAVNITLNMNVPYMQNIQDMDYFYEAAFRIIRDIAEGKEPCGNTTVQDVLKVLAANYKIILNSKYR